MLRLLRFSVGAYHEVKKNLKPNIWHFKIDLNKIKRCLQHRLQLVISFPGEVGRTIDHVPVFGKWSHWFHFYETCFREKINRGKKIFLSFTAVRIFNTQIYFSLSYSSFRNFLFLFSKFRSTLGKNKTVLGNPSDLCIFLSYIQWN
jgi:hypothetical protein